MPKMKTKSSAKKRFKLTGSGRVKAKASHMRHMQMNKPKSMKRKARSLFVLAEENIKSVIENLLPYSRAKKRKAPAAKPETIAAKAEKAAATAKSKAKAAAKPAVKAAAPKAAKPKAATPAKAAPAKAAAKPAAKAPAAAKKPASKPAKKGDK